MSTHPGIDILPKELRFEIWSLIYHTEAGRLVALITKPHYCCCSLESCPRYSPCPKPLAFNICHESRLEAQHQAQKFRDILKLQSESKTPSDDVYIRLDLDTLYITENLDINLFASGIDVREQLRIECTGSPLTHLALDVTELLYESSADVYDLASIFPTIETITVVKTDPEADWNMRILKELKEDFEAWQASAKARDERACGDGKNHPDELCFAVRKGGRLCILSMEDWDSTTRASTRGRAFTFET